MLESISGLMGQLYPGSEAATLGRLQALIEGHRPGLVAPDWFASGAAPLTQRDAMLITYADQVRSAGQPPLAVLGDFCRAHLRGLVSAVHLLPFYPSSSDDGFSVIDYLAVDGASGTWDDVESLARSFRPMFDAVVNHASAQGVWFDAFRRGEPPYDGFFYTVEGQPDLSAVVRPRTTPLLTRFSTSRGDRMVWTTFSADQVDLDYRNPELLCRIVDVLLTYVRRGAQFIRLDAIAFLWKEPGSPCLHLPGTHRVVRLFRAVLDEVAPWVQLITETNVPHADNVTYFGNGRDEAQLVYNFALPPLVLDAFHRASCGALTRWASTLGSGTFLNFLASHDGIGLNPARGLIPDPAIDALVARVEERGGLVSYRSVPGGGMIPYELNVNYFDALRDPAGPEGAGIDRFVAAHAIMLSLRGLPALYFHSLFGSRGWPEGVARTGRARTINRQKCDRNELEAELADPGGRRREIFGRISGLLAARASSEAFHPAGEQRILEVADDVFAVERLSPDRSLAVLCLASAAPAARTIDVGARQGVDLVTGRPVTGRSLELAPHGVRWIAHRA